MTSATPLLDAIDSPEGLRRLDEAELPQLADELRAETIAAVSETGGHLGAGLGVVELTLALHYVFHTPRDLLIWDVGHQAYPHKILTGRRGRIRTLRQKDGLSGFTSRAESEYDPFGAAHSSTSLSAGLGFAAARNLAGGAERVVCVIGDGAMSAGMAYEAMNNIGDAAAASALGDSRFIAVLNRQRHVHRPPGRGDERLPLAAALFALLPSGAQCQPPDCAAHPASARTGGGAGGGIRARDAHGRNAL